MLSNEEVEVEEVEKEEEIEGAEEILVDRLRLLLDVTKLWHKILHGEASIEDLKALAGIEIAKREAKARAQAALRAGTRTRVKKSKRRTRELKRKVDEQRGRESNE